MEARKIFTFIFFLIFVSAAREVMGQPSCGSSIQLPTNSCTNDENCKAKCISLGYTYGYCYIGLPIPRHCVCEKTC
ncbi:hypothetical protein ABFS83_02G123800 [Erythranthe nasuta]